MWPLRVNRVGVELNNGSHVGLQGFGGRWHMTGLSQPLSTESMLTACTLGLRTGNR